jgi:hypothetical protein
MSIRQKCVEHEIHDFTLWKVPIPTSELACQYNPTLNSDLDFLED